MNKLLLLTLLVLLTACGGRIMTQERFADVTIGTPIEDVIKIYGSPNQIREVPPNQKSYEYVERIAQGTSVVQMRYYYFVVTDGKVTGKYLRFNNPPGYDQIYSDPIYPNSGP